MMTQILMMIENYKSIIIITWTGTLKNIWTTLLFLATFVVLSIHPLSLYKGTRPRLTNLRSRNPNP